MEECIPKSVSEKLKLALERGEITPDKIASMLPEEKKALKSLLEEVVTERLGISISSEEIAQISKISKKIDNAQKILGDDLGNPLKRKENVNFWKAKKEMDDYLMSKSPANQLRIATGTVGRGMMLASIKSPILNIGSNIEVGLTEAFSRRFSNLSVKGTDGSLAKEYVRMVNEVYQKTGYDISRMISITDTGAGGLRVLGEDIVHSQGPGAYRKGARVVEDIVFKQLMGAPDVAFSSFHFADSVNVNARKMFKDKNLAKEAMIDAMRLEPKTPAGELLRQQGILDAQMATWTNDSWASKTTESLRTVFNKATGDVRLGDLLFPFIKTPANVIATGMDYAGLGIPKALIKTFEAIRQGTIKDKTVIKSIIRDLIRAGMGLTGAVMISRQLDEDDFVGAYDPQRAQIEQLRNSNYNAVRIGDKWISTDWFGPLSVPLTAMMYARKYGDKGGKEKTFQYAKGVGSAILDLPVISDARDYFVSVGYKKGDELKDMTDDTLDWITNFASSRLIPSILADTANAFDKKQRQSSGNIDKLKAKIPGLRNTLPEKKNIFGETIMGEPALSELMFGSRVKTDRETELIKEINNIIMNSDTNINFTNWDKSSNKSLIQFREKKGDEIFEEAKIKYGEKLKELLEKEIKKDSYKKLNDNEKADLLNSIDSEATDIIFKKYNFKYKSLPKNK